MWQWLALCPLPPPPPQNADSHDDEMLSALDILVVRLPSCFARGVP